ncbi:MAG: M14 family zinc carboxypeptidase [Saprospiraceae bacterium]
MKYLTIPIFYALCAVCLLFAPLQAQNPGHSQVRQTYLKVRINTENGALAKLSALGVAVDHGELANGYFITDLNSDEYALIQKDFNVTVLETDMEKVYADLIKVDQLNPNPPAGERFDCSYSTPTNFNLGSMGSYLTYQQMLDELDQMVALYPDLITVRQTVSPSLTTAEGRPLYYVKISDNPNTDEAEPRILYTALHHAREPMSMMSLIFYMHYLLENYASDPEIQNLVDSDELYFIPCVNPDGYVYNQTTNPNGGGLWRKNRRLNSGGSYGVDLNRNYGYQWGLNSGSSGSQSSDTYRGTSAFSEPETQMIRDFCIEKEFVTALNNHSYGNYLIHQWEYENSVPEPATFAALGAELTTCNNYTIGNAFQTVGYLASGGSGDWMYGEQSAKPKVYNFTPEIGSSFWPAPSSIVSLCENTMRMFLEMAENARCNVLLVNAGNDAAICIGSNATLTAVSSGGTAPFTYNWSNGDTGSSITVSPSVTTTYTVTVTNTNGCAATDAVIITVSDCSGVCGTPQVVVNTNGFETNMGIWTDPGSDCAIVSAYPNSGTKSLQLRDNTSTSLASTGNLNLTAYNKIVVSFSYLCASFDNSAEDFWLQLSTNGGSTYTTKEEWNLGDEFANLARHNENITILGPFTTNTRIRFRCDASADDDQVHLDDITITGCLPLMLGGNPGEAFKTIPKNDIHGHTPSALLYPNPTTDDLNLQLFVETETQRRIVVYDLTGRAVREQNAALNEGWNLVRFDLSGLPKGLYFVADEHENLGKFVKSE